MSPIRTLRLEEEDEEVLEGGKYQGQKNKTNKRRRLRKELEGDDEEEEESDEDYKENLEEEGTEDDDDDENESSENEEERENQREERRVTRSKASGKDSKSKSRVLRDRSDSNNSEVRPRPTSSLDLDQDEKVGEEKKPKKDRKRREESSQSSRHDTCTPKYVAGSSTEEEEDFGMDEEIVDSGGQLRRSARPRTRVSYKDSYDDKVSWIAGGGERAKGYRRTSQSMESEEEEPRYPRRERHSQRPHPRDKEQGQPSDREKEGGGLDDDAATGSGSEFAPKETKPKRTKTWKGHQQQDSEDMYSRVKRRSSRADQSTDQDTSNRKDEPVSRRLRDRKKLTRRQPVQLLGTVSRFDDMLKNSKRRRRDSSSSSDDSDNTQLKSPRKKRGHREFDPTDSKISLKERKMLMEVQPVEVDPSITFKSVGGLNKFIDKLKEIVIFPLVYHEFYEERGMQAPRGVLLHGPPGTGKTLLARALSNECSNINGRKVSFFLRKGADLLNKFVGESERQLRLLFRQAALHQPSIIFFDEIDGLAPVRSAKSDQIHNSIVSSLLAEIDGLQDCGKVIVMGSTNRLDFVDPALRRPGRFDLEIPIFLPTRDGRREILNVHISKSKDPVSEDLLDEMADRTIGFSGADLKFLCWEAGMNSLRRAYPQIYGSSQKYLLDYNKIKVERVDWEQALNSVGPSTQRSLFSTYSPARPLDAFLQQLLNPQLKQVLDRISTLFPQDDAALMNEPSIKRCIVHAGFESGVNAYVIPAILHTYEKVPVHVMSLESLYMDGGDVEFAVTQKCTELLRQSKPCICFLPDFERICDLLSDSSKEIMMRMLTLSIQKPILFLATVEGDGYFNKTGVFNDCNLMDQFKDWVVELEAPTESNIKEFLKPVLTQALIVKVPKTVQTKDLPELPLAPPEVPVKPKLTEKELKAIEKFENSRFRELRIFLRQILGKLARNKKFEEFVQPVDVSEVPDYLKVISHPMDLETMMHKLNINQYHCAKEFLEDIHLIYQNCIEYNPTTLEADNRLRMRGYELVDFAEKLIEDEMDSDFEQECQNLCKARQERIEQQMKEKEKVSKPVTRNSDPEVAATAAPEAETKMTNGVDLGSGSTPSSSSSRPSPARFKKRRISNWAKGTIKKPERKTEANTSIQAGRCAVANDSMPVKATCLPGKDCDSQSSTSYESQSATDLQCSDRDTTPTAENKKGCTSLKDGRKCNNYHHYKREFRELLRQTVRVCRNMSVVRLIDIRFQLLRLINKYQYSEDKQSLVTDIQEWLSASEAQGSSNSNTSKDPNVVMVVSSKK